MTGQQRGTREAVLAKIKRALQMPAPKPGAHGQHSGSHPSSPTGGGEFPSLREGLGEGKRLPVINGNWQQWLPPAGENWDEWAALFARNAEGLKADFHLLENEEELPAALQKLRDENSWQRIASHAGDLTDVATRALELPCLNIAHGYDRDELEKCDAGITLCDALIAQTGSVLITARSAGGRALSVLPPHHVVLARREQLVPDLPAAFELLRATYGENLPSLMSFITGPSRTGDIERILVLGAHGPRQLTIFCV
jgi:L-lactate dehydrogenase complex protein LldG